MVSVLHADFDAVASSSVQFFCSARIRRATTGHAGLPLTSSDACRKFSDRGRNSRHESRAIVRRGGAVLQRRTERQGSVRRVEGHSGNDASRG